jgi:hypothetical protein
VVIVVGGVFFLNRSGSGSSNAVSASGTTPPAANPARAAGVAGTVSTVDGSTLTVKTTANGRFAGGGAAGGTAGTTPTTTPTPSTVTVKTNSSTTVTEAVTATVGDLAVGDHVLAIGTSANGTVTAVSLTDTGATASNAAGRFGGGGGAGGGGFQRPAGANGTPPQGAAGAGGGGFAGGQFALGTVKSVDASSVTVTETDGSEVTMAVASTTRITKQEARTVADIKVGDTVRVTSQQSGDVITATSIQMGDLTAGGPGGLGFGRRQGQSAGGTS